MTTPLRIGIAGLGTVGCGVVRTLVENAELVAARAGRPVEITAVCARDPRKNREVDVSAWPWVADPVLMARRDDVDVVVELIGGADGIARETVEAALIAGKDVVTANKALLAMHGGMLGAAADKTGRSLRYEAAVAGGIPIIKGLREGLAGNAVRRVSGILNGTCNYILSEMEATKRSFLDVLRDAQRKGYAEADPSFDVSGVDAAHKTAILASVAFGTRVAFETVHVEGIERIEAEDIKFAREFGYRIKLLGIASLSEDGIEARVHPALVRHGTPLADVGGVMNAVQVEADPVQRTFFEGPGAGEGPTASAVVADIIDLARGARLPVFMTHTDQMKTYPSVPIADRVGTYYVRLGVIDKPGVMAEVTSVFAEHGLSLDSLLQRGRSPGEAVPVVMLTHEARDAVMTKALEEVASLEAVIETPCLIRIEAV